MSSVSFSDRVTGTLFFGAACDAQSSALHPDNTATLNVTASSQTLLYVIDGLLEAVEWAHEGSAADPAACVWLAMLRWYKARQGHFPEGTPAPLDRWIDEQPVATHEVATDTQLFAALEIPEMPLPQRPADTEADSPMAAVRSIAYGMLPKVTDEFIGTLTRAGDALTHGSARSMTTSQQVALLTGQLFAGATVDELTPPEDDTRAGSVVAWALFTAASMRESLKPVTPEIVVQTLADCPEIQPEDLPAAATLAGAFIGAQRGSNHCMVEGTLNKDARVLLTEATTRWVTNNS